MNISNEAKIKLFDLQRIHKEIYLLDISFFTKELGSCVAIRPLTRSEFNLYKDISDYHTIRDIVNLCSTFLCEINDHTLAGVDYAIAKAIVTISGYNNKDSLVDKINHNRSYSKTLEGSITIFICKAFPSLTPIEIDNMNLSDQMKLLCMAEQLLCKEFPFEFFIKDRLEPSGIPKEPQGKQFANSAGPGAGKHVVVDKGNLHKIMRQDDASRI